MENNELFMTEEVLENRFEAFTDDFDADMALNDVNPWLLIATFGNKNAA